MIGAARSMIGRWRCCRGGEAVSLSVDAFVRDQDSGERKYLDVTNPEKQTAGFERYRTDFWGADVMKSLGLTLLPMLKEQYGLEVEGTALDELEREAETILENITLVSQNTHLTLQDVQFYVGNVLDAIHMARGVRGGVIIW